MLRSKRLALPLHLSSFRVLCVPLLSPSPFVTICHSLTHLLTTGAWQSNDEQDEQSRCWLRDCCCSLHQPRCLFSCIKSTRTNTHVHTRTHTTSICMHGFTRTRARAHTHTLSLSLFLSLSRFLSLTHTHTHTHIPSPKNTGTGVMQAWFKGDWTYSPAVYIHTHTYAHTHVTDMYIRMFSPAPHISSFSLSLSLSTTRT